MSAPYVFKNERALPYSNLPHLCASGLQHPALACLISAMLKQLTFTPHDPDERAQTQRGGQIKA